MNNIYIIFIKYKLYILYILKSPYSSFTYSSPYLLGCRSYASAVDAYFSKWPCTDSADSYSSKFTNSCRFSKSTSLLSFSILKYINTFSAYSYQKKRAGWKDKMHLHPNLQNSFTQSHKKGLLWQEQRKWDNSRCSTPLWSHSTIINVYTRYRGFQYLLNCSLDISEKHFRTFLPGVKEPKDKLQETLLPRYKEPEMQEALL